MDKDTPRNIDRDSANAQNYKEANEQKEAFEALRKHYAWDKLRNGLKEVIEKLSDEVLNTPLENLDAAVRQEFVKGQLYGIKLVLNAPDEMVKNAIEVIEQLEEVHFDD